MAVTAQVAAHHAMLPKLQVVTLSEFLLQFIVPVCGWCASGLL
jgi:hypothetical protein